MLFSRTQTPKNEIDLILSSSGSRAPCFIGGLAALEEKNYTIKRIAGSSGGALVAAAYALEIPINKMATLAKEMSYDLLRDYAVTNLLSVSNPSVYSGRALDEFLQRTYEGATLKDFKMDCRISVVTIINKRKILLSKDSHPDLPVWQAVRMSSTVPFIFPYLTLNGEPVTDGGLDIINKDIFSDSSRPVVVLRPKADYVLKKGAMVKTGPHKLFIWNYLKILAEYLLDAVDLQHLPEAEWEKTIIIPTYERGGFNFDLTSEDIDRLIDYGYQAVISATNLPYTKN
jgi:predicted patatin/cPLA2 family phospholipase